MDALQLSIGLVDDWMRNVGTNNGLRSCVVKYALGRGGETMEDITRRKGQQFHLLGISQDKIGWRRFMEGMVSKQVLPIQKSFADINGSALSSEEWTKGLAIKLMEATHGQWLYKNIQTHDSITGTNATSRKEELQRLIEEQIDLGGDGLEEKDKYLLEIKLEDLTTTSGETQTYWLLAIRAARDGRRLRAEQSD